MNPPSDHPSRHTFSESERYQLLVAGINDYAIYMLDPDGYVSSWNAGAERFKGYKPDEIIGQHFSRFYVPDDRAAGIPANALQAALATGKFEAEGCRVRKDGSTFWASVVIDPIFDQAGNHIGFAKITRDITERKAAQDKLRQSEEHFRLLVQGVTDYAIYMLGLDGRVTNWNAGAQRIKGYTASEVLDTHFSRFHTPEDQSQGLPAKSLATAAAKGRYEQEGWRVRKGGTRFWAHVVIDAIYDANANLVGFAKVTRDITEQKEAQEELDLANAALFQSQKMEALGQLTGGIAHDFNNLLSVLASGLDVLTTHDRKHNEVKMIESMRRAVDRGATLTQQLLSFARQQPLRADVFDLNLLISNFDPVLRRAGNSLISFHIDLKASLATVMIDPARFEAAMLNLVVNARDAMPSGGKIRLTTENADLRDRQVGGLPAGHYVAITVQDTGLGMETEVAKRAFDPFFTTKSLGKGTGLGLSQVHGFIAQSGGDVLISSEPGKGAAVSMYLPVAQASANDVVRQREGTDTVLVVEDEADLLEVAAELVRSIGYEVVTAANGADALNILTENPAVDILFTDVVMSNGISGVELARKARSLRPDLKVLLASGYPLPVLKSEHGSLDDYNFMNKPYKLAELAKKLRASA